MQNADHSRVKSGSLGWSCLLSGVAVKVMFYTFRGFFDLLVYDVYGAFSTVSEGLQIVGNLKFLLFFATIS